VAEPPLTGLRVVEFGQLLAGPYVGTLLGDFGAEIVKVEAPPAGDPMRDWGRLRHNDHSLWWSILARNKRSVTLNLRTERARELAAQLCARADVLVENFRPGTMERWGLGPDDVHAVNPRCVYARVSGYGQTGRYRDRPGFASAGEAIGGRRAINGYPDQAPPRSGISLGDTLAAQSAFQGILLALYARDARGAQGAEGQVVDASITDACFAMLESAVVEYEKTGAVREPTGPRLPRIAPSNEAVIVKRFASAFHGTDLATLLARGGCDTLVVCGASTSGCVRASAVDALQHGLVPVVAREAVGDRWVAAHEANLFDLEQKYADVAAVDDVVAALSAGREGPGAVHEPGQLAAERP
jgi:CoA-transferase family III/Isochorismatase family